MKLNLEALEARDCPVVNLTLTGTQLSIYGPAGPPHNVVVQNASTLDTIQVTADGVVTTWTGIRLLAFTDSAGNGTLANYTLIPGLIYESAGSESIYEAAGGCSAYVNGGGNFLQFTGGNNYIEVGGYIPAAAGNTVIAGSGDRIVLNGNGDDIVYAPNAASVYAADYHDHDVFYVSASTLLYGLDETDTVVIIHDQGGLFGQQGRRP
jgi:hypothetical protein